jgi:hypothetical protein
VAGAQAVPQAVLDALRFYAHGHHYNIDADHQQFDTVSGEPPNWLHSERDDDCTMIEDGSIARAALCGGVLGWEEPTEPVAGEVLRAAPVAPAAAAQPDERMSDAARDVLAERTRQVSDEGWDTAHDDRHVTFSLSQAAACYVFHACGVYAGKYPVLWPWDGEYWKPTTPRRDLVKAGALIIAEIERIDRASDKS